MFFNSRCWDRGRETCDKKAAAVFLDIFVCEYGAAEEYTFIIRNGNGWKS